MQEVPAAVGASGADFALRKAARRRARSDRGGWLHHNGGNLARTLRKEHFQRTDIVVIEKQGIYIVFRRNAGLERRDTDEPVVEREKGMLARDADETPAGHGARYFHGCSRDIRPVLREFHHFG